MSDEIGGFVFGEPPPEVAEAIQKHYDQQQMIVETLRHDLKRMLEEMPVDHLTTLRDLLHRAYNGSEAILPYIEGQIVGALQWKHGVCGGCGTKHDDASSLLGSPQPVDNAVDIPQPITPSDVSDALNYSSDMELYNLRLPNDGEVEAGPGESPVICRGCGILYQSIEDRMLRKPDECHGCIQKSAWG